VDACGILLLLLITSVLTTMRALQGCDCETYFCDAQWNRLTLVQSCEKFGLLIMRIVAAERDSHIRDEGAKWSLSTIRREFRYYESLHTLSLQCQQCRMHTTYEWIHCRLQQTAIKPQWRKFLIRFRIIPNECDQQFKFRVSASWNNYKYTLWSVFSPAHHNTRIRVESVHILHLISIVMKIFPN
jgi:hypothetical protein